MLSKFQRSSHQSEPGLVFYGFWTQQGKLGPSFKVVPLLSGPVHLVSIIHPRPHEVLELHENVGLTAARSPLPTAPRQGKPALR